VKLLLSTEPHLTSLLWLLWLWRWVSFLHHDGQTYAVAVWYRGAADNILYFCLFTISGVLGIAMPVTSRASRLLYPITYCLSLIKTLPPGWLPADGERANA